MRGGVKAEQMPDENAAEIEAAIFAGHKIAAIKAYRERTGKGLKESKDFIEALEQELRQTSPEKFTAPPGGKGCGGAVMMLLLVVLFFVIALTMIMSRR
jgi:hypothetical protein